jgi:hypothetical protein
VGPLASADEDPELTRIREILVGPHLRDQQRRLSALEGQMAEARTIGDGAPAEWRTQIEVALAQERRAREEHAQAQAHTLEQLDAALERECEMREEQAQSQVHSISQLMEALTREREERQAVQARLEESRRQQGALQAALEREREAREELADLHARALSELAQQQEHERDAHVRLHALHATELDARLAHEREMHAEEIRRVASAHATPSQALQSLVAEAERALVAMQQEREYLAGLLAELGLHLIRHAASPAAATAEQTTRTLQGAVAETNRSPQA